MRSVPPVQPSHTRPEKEPLTRQKLESTFDTIRRTYLADSRPWVIGYSGGKDSTSVVQLVWQALSQLPKDRLTKPVFIIASDTLVETPVIENYLQASLDRMNQAAKEQGLSFEAHKVSPEIDQTFWVNLIGRGYPAPYNKFRWCTDRMKIDPANAFIMEKVARYGEVIILLGARRSESATRAQVMNLRKEIGDQLSRHSNLPNAWVFTPIEDWETNDVWTYLLNSKSPWGSDNRELVTMYRNAQAGECPLVIDKTTPSCGNSRFGCWTCTVVDRDKSMEAMIDKGEEWMESLLEFRDFLADTQDPRRKREIREHRRRTGRVEYWEKDGKKKIIWGPYKLVFRQEILRRLLEVQKRVRREGANLDVSLISSEELLRIRELWRSEEGDWEDSVGRIYLEVTGEPLPVSHEDWSGMGRAEYEVLEEVCRKHNLPARLLTNLFEAEKTQHGMSRRSAIYDRIDSIMRKDWRDREDVLSDPDVLLGGDDEETEEIIAH